MFVSKENHPYAFVGRVRHKALVGIRRERGAVTGLVSTLKQKGSLTFCRTRRAHLILWDLHFMVE